MTEGESKSSAKQSKVKKKSKRKKRKKTKARRKAARSQKRKTANYPRHSLDKALRVPKAILEQNAGKMCTELEAASFVNVGYGGTFRLEVSSALKFGLMERPKTGQVAITDLAKKILRPQRSEDEINGLREAVLKAPDISEVYSHYRGENLPDPQFFSNALIDKFNIPEDKVSEFQTIFLETLKTGHLLEEHDGKRRVLDVSQEGEISRDGKLIKRIGKEVSVKSTDKCFVMMPFKQPIGGYYSTIYEPAIKKAGLTPIRADIEIFGTGKIMDQIWRGINEARVLVAELTDRNPNVFYELGLAHASDKPVVLVSSNETDVPFDLQHIRVIYYKLTDPFWGNKLIEKIAENILSALANPEEALFKKVLETRK